MIVKLFDKSEIIVTTEQGQKIAQLKAIGQPVIDINGTMVDPKAIAIIKPSGEHKINKQLPKQVETEEDYQKARQASDRLRKRLFNDSDSETD